MNSSIIDTTQQFVEKIFAESLSSDFVYHDWEHTKTVQMYCKLLGEHYQISEQDMEILQVGALLHDVGYIKIYVGHEKAGMEIAREFLEKQQYPDAFIDKVEELIEATQLEHEARDLFEQIIKDADLSTIGSEDFEGFSDRLRHEWAVICDEHYEDGDWYENNINFLKNHQFQTDKAKELFGKMKKKNLKKMKKRMKKEKLKSEAPKKEKPTGIDSSKSAQMIFKTSLRNHIDLTNIADSKASMMLSINALVISITIPLLAPLVEDRMFLLLPASFLLTTCVLTIIYATLATRPIKMTGLTDFEKIKTGKTNLFFFGNFYEMDLPSYQKGLDEVIGNKDILENSIVNDLYYLGKALGNKYAKLRVCYSIFMIGITSTVIAFAIAFFIAMKSGTLNG